MNQDREIAQKVMNALTDDPYIDETRLQVSVENGTVVLQGSVGSLVHKRLAGAIAWWVPGVQQVINELEVTPPEEDGDDQITEACKIVLEKDPLVDATEVLVRTRDGVVTLMGAVDGETERDLAERDCRYVWGVRDVINLLTVIPPETPPGRDEYGRR